MTASSSLPARRRRVVLLNGALPLDRVSCGSGAATVRHLIPLGYALPTGLREHSRAHEG